MGQYAKETKVPAEQSRAEIEKTLKRYGADAFMYGDDGDKALVMFRMDGRHIRFTLPLPNIENYGHTPTGKTRSKSSMADAYKKDVRQKWRALLLTIKAKLESVDSGITVFDEEFMAQIVLPDGGTIGEHMMPQIEHAYETGKMPSLLPGPQS